MKKIPPLILMLVAFHLHAQILKSSEGEVSFFSKALIENISATNKNFQSILIPGNNAIRFIVPITGFTFKKSLMQEHFNEEYLESDKYPFANYKGIINEKIDWTKDGNYTVTATGTLNIHNVNNERTDTAQIIIKNGTISISGNFLVRLADYNIKIPRMVIQNIAEVIEVKFITTFAPYKKEF